MKLPEIQTIESERNMVATFLGYNHNDAVNEYAANQFYEMQNLSSDAYPALSTRKKRGIIHMLSKANGLASINGLAYVDGTELYYNGIKVCDVGDNEKILIGMGANLVIFPDNIIYNTYTNTVEKMDFHYTTENPVLFTLCNYQGKDYVYYTGEKEPDVSAYQYWLDTSGSESVLKMWSKNSSQWVSVPTSYVKIMECPTVKIDGIKIECEYVEPENPPSGVLWCDLADDTLYRCERSEEDINWIEEKNYEVEHQSFGKHLSEYDGVNLSGCLDDDFNTCMILYGTGEDFVVVSGVLEKVFLQGKHDAISFDRNIPKMDYVCESNNRLWGCSEKGHEIYACKLGDPKNWESYAGLASDSYSLTVGSPGDFTGCIAHLGYVLFFKEDCMLKIYGTEPSNYTMTTTYCRGVQKGSSSSLKILNELLYYKSVSEICIYDGSMPTEISADLGTDYYSNAVAGVLGSKYYISMRDADLKYHLFVYDSKKGMWHREDNSNITCFANYNGGLYCTDKLNRLLIINTDRMTGKLVPGMTTIQNGIEKKIYPSSELYPGKIMGGDIDTEEIEWFAETNIQGLDMPDKKYVSKITLRLSVEKGSVFRMYIQYDSDGDWIRLLDMNATSKRSQTIPVRLRRCDHYKLRFEGIGEFRLFSYTKTLMQGSDW